MYALQSLQPYPPAILKQIRGEQLTKNNTNQPMRWKDIAWCESKEILMELMNDFTGRRIVNLENLEVVAKNYNYHY